MTYQHAIEYLMSFLNLEKAPGQKYRDDSYNLDDFRQLLNQLGNPQNSFKSILVAGTKGKGSTAAFIESALSAQGLKAGLYTSPHLISFCERIKLGGRSILERDFAQRLDWLKPFLEKQKVNAHSKTGGRSTVFEILTAMAFLYFQEMRIDWAVLEVGLGGRLDCTNVVNPRVSVITNISHDHTEILGESLKEIAGEKAGIIRQDGLAVTSPQGAEALKVIMNRCRELNARLFQVGKDVIFKISEQNPEHLSLDLAGTFGKLNSVELGLNGDFQAENAATAFAALRALQFRNQQVGDPAIRKGFKDISWPGRLQTVSRHPLIIIDGAHNDYSAYRLKKAVEILYPEKTRILVLGISANKDIGGIVSNLVPQSRVLVITKAKHSRAATPEAIRREAKKFAVPVIETETLCQALDRAKELAMPQDLVLVTGSLFLAGETLELLGKKI
ncbi:bifunctional folylpolyglutamate synthase/dihydrofolate synthase [candidate division TA06 bacterium]|uniref:tetrahydrofolate synthase n=1 Tax=candidate division TA06 bacterium TaxID=2250710 RepID=A0A933IBQ8_UNCT6|nr:bifunctional folylpolyglutamate synthase/dihydrofolate synthase [candidate division TA06 bacterium]